MKTTNTQHTESISQNPLDSGLKDSEKIYKKIWKKLSTQTKRIGRQTVETGLKLYYSARDEKTPAWARTVIYGALVYFLVPIDAIPDLIPGGYTDDLTTLLAALATVGMHITPTHKQKAEDVASHWFDDPELQETQTSEIKDSTS